MEGEEAEGRRVTFELSEGRRLMRKDFLSVLALAKNLLPRDHHPVVLRGQALRSLMGVASGLRGNLHLL